MGCTAPQPPQVLLAEVISTVKIVPSRPPIAFPSSSSSPGRTALPPGWAEALGPDRPGVVSELDQRPGDGFDERRRSADEGQRRLTDGPCHLMQHLPVDTPGESPPAGGLSPGQGEVHGQAVLEGGQPLQLPPVDDVVDGADGVEQPGGDPGAAGPAM